MHYIVVQTKQIGIDTDSPDSAIQAVMGGAGDVINVNYSANPRQQQQQPITRPGFPPQMPPSAPSN